MPRFEVKVTRRDGERWDAEAATQSGKSKCACIECSICIDSKCIDTPELLSRDGAGRVPLSCRAASRPGDE